MSQYVLVDIPDAEKTPRVRQHLANSISQLFWYIHKVYRICTYLTNGIDQSYVTVNNDDWWSLKACRSWPDLCEACIDVLYTSQSPHIVILLLFT